MSRKYFGTDGVRGLANTAPMDPQTIMRCGMAAGSLFSNGHRPRVVIGKDTRLSGYMVEQALTAGFLSVGMDVFLSRQRHQVLRSRRLQAFRRTGAAHRGADGFRRLEAGRRARPPALDGDADRVVIADEKGRLVDGDQLLGLIATYLLEKGQLAGGGVVATIMSNLGLERYLEGFGLKLERTKVGDRYVMERMRQGGYNVGGEQSGHIILTDHTTTGDGLIAALQVLAVVVTKERRVSEICHVFDPVPQLLENVRYSGSAPLEDPAVRAARPRRLTRRLRNVENGLRILNEKRRIFRKPVSFRHNLTLRHTSAINGSDFSQPLPLVVIHSRNTSCCVHGTAQGGMT